MNYSLENRKGGSSNKNTPAREAGVKIITPTRAAAKPNESPVRIQPNNPRHSPQRAQSQQIMQNTPQQTIQNTPKITDEAIYELLTGYIVVHPQMWDHIPSGSHIRYFKKGPEPINDRFKQGGFVRNHFITEEGKKMMMIETRIGGKRGEAGYVSFPLAYETIDILHKKYDRGAFIEIHLTFNSLAQKKQQIEKLEERVANLENILRGIVRG